MHKIIDTHQHFWDLTLNKNNWLVEKKPENYLGDLTTIRHSYLIADFLKDSDTIPIYKTVHVQAGWDKEDLLGESQWLLTLQDASARPHAIVAYADLSNTAIETILAQQALIPSVKGIRQIINWHSNPFYSGCDKNYIQADAWKNNFSLLRKHALSFDMQIYPEQVDDIIPLLCANDEIDVVINHALMPTRRDKAYLAYWREQLKKLSYFPQIKIKISGIAMFDHNWSTQSFKEIISPVIETFSPARCMLGSNFPVDKLYGSYQKIMLAYIKIISKYTETEQAAIFHQTAARFYKI